LGLESSAMVRELNACVFTAIKAGTYPPVHLLILHTVII
jgi:hypothetical protein